MTSAHAADRAAAGEELSLHVRHAWAFRRTLLPMRVRTMHAHDCPVESPFQIPTSHSKLLQQDVQNRRPRRALRSLHRLGNPILDSVRRITGRYHVRGRTAAESPRLGCGLSTLPL
jgi:hypothetical protein